MWEMCHIVVNAWFCIPGLHFWVKILVYLTFEITCHLSLKKGDE